MSFKRVITEPTRRAIMSLYGGDKTGKTTFGLTMPDPLIALDFNKGLVEIAHKFAYKDIYHEVYDYDPKDRTLCEKSWDRYQRDFDDALHDSTIRSILIDTGTEARSCGRMAEIGALVLPDATRFKFKTPNEKWSRMIVKSFGKDKNVLFTHEVKPEYIDDKFTGNFLRDGDPKMGGRVQLEVRQQRYEDDDGNFQSITSKITSCRFDVTRTGEEFEMVFEEVDGMLYVIEGGFPFICSDVIGGELEDWGYVEW